MSFCAPGMWGEPVDTVMVRPEVPKVPIAEGAMVKYIGDNSDYYGVTMQVAGIRKSNISVLVYLKRPRTHPKYGYVVAAQPYEVVAL